MLSLLGPAPYLWVKKSKSTKQSSQQPDNAHKLNGLPPAFYTNQRTPVTTTPASLTPMSITPAPGTPEPELADDEDPQIPPRKHEPGTAVVQVFNPTYLFELF